jgi:hypothetical protein
VALLAGAGVSLMITPYGTGIVGYYRSTMLDSSLRHVITEWGPITSMPVVAGALAAVVVIALWAVWRHRARSTPWERLALLLLAAGSASVVRNAVFFGLFALIVVPFWIGHDAASRPLTQRRARLPWACCCGYRCGGHDVRAVVDDRVPLPAGWSADSRPARGSYGPLAPCDGRRAL